MADLEFLLPKPLQDGLELSTEWPRFKEEFHYYLTASEKADKSDKIKIAILLRCIGPRGLDTFKSFVFEAGKSKENYDDVIEKFDQSCKRGSNKIIMRHQLLSMKQGYMSMEDYISRLHKIARECNLNDMYNEFMLQALLLGINDESLRRKLFEETEELTLENAIRKCKIAETSKKDLKLMKHQEEEETVHVLNSRKTPRRQTTYEKHKSPLSNCGNCGTNHPPRKCPAYGKQCQNCRKFNHFRAVCRSRRQQVNQVSHEEEEDSDSTESLMHIQVVRKDKKLVSTVLTDAITGKIEIEFQLDTGASCNILNQEDYKRLGNPPLSNKHMPMLKLYDGTKTKPYGKCEATLEGHTFRFFVVQSTNRSLLSLDACLKLGLITVNNEWVNVVSYEDHIEIDELLHKHKAVFKGVGCLPGEYHIEIDPNSTPSQCQNRRVALSMKKDLKEKIETLTKAKILEKVDYPTPWISNALARRKPNGKLRLCIDPTNLNKAIKRNHFPMPTLEDVLPELDGAKVFSLCDAKDGFLQIKLDTPSSDLTTFWSPFGKYKWLRMPFGLTASPEEFQRRLTEAMAGLQGVMIVADDILIYGKGETTEDATQDHNKNLQRLLERAESINLKLNKEKCRFLLKELNYIGHRISKDGIKKDPMKTKAIDEMATPKDSDAVRRFLGHITYLSRFIPNCSAETEPLRRLIGVTKQEFQWGKDQQQAFETLKRLATADTTLQYFKVNHPVIVQCDASTEGLGGALIQDNKPVAFASRSLTESEKKYAPIELELLAIVFAMQRFDQYVFGNPEVHIHTDHEPLTSIWKKSLLKAPRRLQSMLLALQRYPAKLHYIPGCQQHTADMLSRSSTEQPLRNQTPEGQIFQIQTILADLDMVNPQEDTSMSPQTYRKIKAASQQDQNITLVKRMIYRGWKCKVEEISHDIKPYFHVRDQLTVLDDIIYKGPQMVIPRECRGDILKKLHTSHQGISATLRRARSCVFWPQMAEDIRRHVEQCVNCSLDAQAPTKETIQHHAIPAGPWIKLGMDLCSFKNEEYLIVVDYFSDFFEYKMLKKSSTNCVIEACKKMFARFGIPKIVHSDNGPQFTSAEFETFSREWGFVHTSSSPRHPQSNGKAESAVKIFKRILKRADDPHLAILEYRNTPTAGMTSTPIQRMLGKSTRSIIPTCKSPRKSTDNTVIREKARKKVMTQRHYNHSAKDLKSLKIGTPVLIKTTNTLNKNTWSHGKVVETLSDRSYAILNEETGNIIRRNRVDLRENQTQTERNPEKTPEVLKNQTQQEKDATEEVREQTNAEKEQRETVSTREVRHEQRKENSDESKST